MSRSLLFLMASLCAAPGLVPRPARATDASDDWDVQNPPGPRQSVHIDTHTGTWMSLDVSPDGKQIVFDLLGDLYLLPFSGGKARSLTSGIAWDMQPCFSPDGHSIAFTSDRGGGDNLWLIPLSGGAPRALTQESFRLLNSPTWTPDGRSVVGRKHFTARRSLGAGELWLINTRGGDGVPLVERTNDQKDIGEPAFSPDGRFLYYSQDVTPGDVFEYNKDPNGEIYVIFRLEVESGDTHRLVTGPGGAVRPTPSPDGRSLAFVRRIRDHTVLMLRNLESGAERVLFDGLDRDLQETWAIHGVYPRMAWTPDSREIVFWAGGHLQRVGLDGKAPAEIPFHVVDTRTVQPAVRFPVDPAPRRFPVRALRTVRVSPDGKRVIYQALGYLWTKRLPDGTPKRLTHQTRHFEFMPAWSRDGRRITYVTWSDAKLGTVRLVAARGGQSKVLTRKPGHYMEPVFTPDGTQIVYRRGKGGWLRPRTWSSNPGLYRISVSGGPSTLITKSGRRPHFGRNNGRVYFDDTLQKGAVGLASIGLDGRKYRLHLRGGDARQIAVSPDESWVAFSMHHRAYVAAFIRSGKVRPLGPKEKGLPLARVSQSSAAALHWAGDSSGVYWARGAELFHADLTDAFPRPQAVPKSNDHKTSPTWPTKGTAIGFVADTFVPSGVTAIVGARIVTMRGQEVIPRGTVVVRGDHIEAVGPSASVTVPKGAYRVDGAGLTVIPGLIDVHAHGAQATDGITPQRNWRHDAMLAFGVTSIHDPSNDTESIFAASELQRTGQIASGRIFSTGTLLYGARAPYTADVDSLEDARGHLRRQKAYGAFSVKSYNQPRRDQRQQILAAARELHMLVVPEGGSLFHHNMTQVVDGHTGIEHAIPLAALYDDVLQFWTGTEVGYTPTLTVAYGGLMGEWYFYQNERVWEHERLNRFVPRRAIDPKARRPKHMGHTDWNHIKVARWAKRFIDAGGHVQIGGHGQREGLGTHWEMWALAQGGATPFEVLRAATIDGARYLGLDAHLGSIEVGKLADLAILSQNPLEDLRNSEHVRFVMVGGRLFDAATMDELAHNPHKRPTMFFESEP